MHLYILCCVAELYVKLNKGYISFLVSLIGPQLLRNGCINWIQIFRDNSSLDVDSFIVIYSVFFFMPTKVNANFTYLYLIEINDWCLIFSSMFGHLIIYKEIQILIIMLLVKLENLKLVGFQFCRVETRIYCYTKFKHFLLCPVSAL